MRGPRTQWVGRISIIISSLTLDSACFFDGGGNATTPPDGSDALSNQEISKSNELQSDNDINDAVSAALPGPDAGKLTDSGAETFEPCTMANPATCDDKAECTQDKCDPSLGCIHSGAYFSKTYSSQFANATRVGGVVQVGDGFAVIHMAPSVASGIGTAQLARFTDFGELLWSKTFGDNGIGHFAFGLVASPDAFVFVGTAGESSQFQHVDGWMVRTDLDGNMVWDKTFGTKDHDEHITALVLLPDGYASVGPSGTSAPTDPKSNVAGWLLRTDENGNLLWQKFYPNPTNSFPFALVALPTGFAFAGSTGSDPSKPELF